MILFELRRLDDSGDSLTVAQGVIFDHGWCALTWLGANLPMAFYTSIESVIEQHGRDGKTKVFKVFEYDKENSKHLMTNEYQDECENVFVGLCESGKYLWGEREKFAKFFKSEELL